MTGQFWYSPSMDQLAGLTEEVRKLAFSRFRLLQPHLGKLKETLHCAVTREQIIS
jgi:hypothetical protein